MSPKKKLKKYSITKRLTNCTINNTASSISSGSSYSAIISSKNGYRLTSISCSMGGVFQPVNIATGKINISKVTGDIIITASGTKIASTTPIPVTSNHITLSITDPRIDSIIEEEKYSTISFSDAFNFWDSKVKFPSKVNVPNLKKSPIYRDMFSPNQHDVKSSFRYNVVKNGYVRFTDIHTNSYKLTAWGSIMLRDTKAYPTETIHIGIGSIGFLGYNKLTRQWDVITKSPSSGYMYTIPIISNNGNEIYRNVSTKVSNGYTLYEIPANLWYQNGIDYCLHFFSNAVNASEFTNYDYVISYSKVYIQESSYADRFVMYQGGDVYRGTSTNYNIDEIGGSRFKDVITTPTYYWFTNTPESNSNLYSDITTTLINKIES